MGSVALMSSGSQIAIFLLSAISVGGVLFALFHKSLSRDVRLETRLQYITGSRGRSSYASANSEESRRKKLVEDTLREMDAKQKAKSKKGAKPTHTSRMRQAGLTWSRNTYFLIAFTTGVVAYMISIGVLKTGLMPAIGFGFAAGLLVPHFIVAQRRKSRFARFSEEFPNALDVVVRGVKSGMPLVDCLKAISADAQEPVKSEFTIIIEDQTLGVPIDAAVQRLAERIPLTETNFFAIVIAIQSRIGGNLSEALGNLSKVLRDRKNLKGKIRAMSAEAKASAGIIGSMPVVVTVLLYLVSPDYITLLATTTTGNIVVAGSLAWMFTGIMVMRKMINFDF